MSLTQRQRKILFILAKEIDPVSSLWIAKKLGVSDRTIREEIKYLQTKSDTLGVNIQTIKGKGYLLKEIDKEALSNTVFKEDSISSKDLNEHENRIIYILKKLLMTKDYIKLENLQDELFISRSTMQNDLKEVRDILEKYNLKIVYRPHYGSCIEGEEFMKRLCLSNTLHSRGTKIGGKLGSLLDENLFTSIKEILIEKIHEHKIEISDVSLMNLVTHISIACKRIKEGFIIQPVKIMLDGDYTFERIVSKEIITEVEKLTKLKFPLSEIDYITVHLLGTKLLQQKDLVDYSENSENDDVKDLLFNILNNLYNEFNWDFRQDLEFINSLILHLRPALNRLKYDMNIRNPLLSEIKAKYPDAFEGAVIASKCIEEKIGKSVGEDEIGYIALHIGLALERMRTREIEKKRVLLVCATGMGSAKLLAYRIQNVLLNEIDIIDTISLYKLETYDLANIDMIITTTPINKDLGIPVLMVSAFLEENDIHSIKEMISTSGKDNKSFLHPSRIFIHKEFNDKESAIHYLCNQLYSQNLVPIDYEKLVLERERLASTCYGNLVAIPHPIRPVTNETFWTICTLKKPIQWDENRMVQFICLLNINKENDRDLSKMYQRLIHILQNPSEVQRLITCDDKKEIINIMCT